MQAIKERAYIPLLTRDRGTPAIVLLTTFSLAIRLYALADFPVPTWDEIGYVRLGEGYITGAAHGPLGFCLILAGEYLFGKNAYGCRVFPVLFGTACIPLIYVVGKRLFRSDRVALAASVLLAFDPMLFVLSRLGVLEPFVCFFVLLTVALWTSGRPVLSGVAMGCGLCVKLSGLPLWLGVTAIASVLAIRSRPARLALFSCLVVAPMVYLVLYCLLKPCFHPAEIVRLHQVQFQNAAAPPAAYLSSPWWSWLLIPQYIPIGERVLDVGGRQVHGVLKLIEIPALAWAAALATVLALIGWTRSRGRMKGLGVPILCFSLLYLPLALLQRGTYLYYVLPALPFAYLLLARFLLTSFSSRRASHLVTLAFLTYVAAAFVFLYPHLMGWRE